MTATVYLGRAAQDQIARARTLAGGHVMSWHNGRCAACDDPAPCLTAIGALFVLSRYGILPHRTPGTSRPDRSPTGRGATLRALPPGEPTARS